MAPKTKSHFLCTECGEVFLKWMGKCTSCGSFNTITEYKEPKEQSGSGAVRRKAGASAGLTSSTIQKLSDCSQTEVERISTGYGELDTLFGGGIVKGSMTLVGGSPGIGKSTLILQVAAHISTAGHSVLYISGEESVEQIALRANRLTTKGNDIDVLTETSVEIILDAVASVTPTLLVIDSIQTLFTDSITSAPGSVSQVRECTAMLMSLAKKQGISLIIIGHVTKDGSLAGPRVLEHMVDTVISFEGENNYSFRIVRGQKNRFGPSGEIALFDMGPTGLTPMANAAHCFILENSKERPGCAVVPLLEGTRILMVEVQALVSTSHFGTPQRVASGINQKKLALIIAVLEKYAGVTLGDYDIFLNITGGLQVNEPAVDLAIAAALISSFRNRAIPKGHTFVGELGLSGEIRPVADMKKRIKEVRAMGFDRVVGPPLAKLTKDEQLALKVCSDVATMEQILL